MKTYAAIGHFRESKNMVSVAMKASTKKNFAANLGGNAFVPYIIITEGTLERLKTADGDAMETFEIVKGLTSNYRIWNEVTDYIEQCLDILEERIQNA